MKFCMAANEDDEIVSPISNLATSEEQLAKKEAGKSPLRANFKNHLSKFPNRNRGIYLLPNIVTTGALFAGFFAIVAGMNGQYVQAAWSVFIAAALDTADGRVARLTNTESDFGKEYDSLSDLVAFGVAPALVAFSWGLSTLGQIGWVVTFIYIACAALRLARFNTKEESKNFIGLASPAAACLMGCCFWVWSEFIGGEVTVGAASVMAGALLLSGLLMVSNFLYYSPKETAIRDRVPFISLVLVIFTFSIILLEPSLVLLFIGVTYALSGPFNYFFKKIQVSDN